MTQQFVTEINVDFEGVDLDSIKVKIPYELEVEFRDYGIKGIDIYLNDIITVGGYEVDLSKIKIEREDLQCFCLPVNLVLRIKNGINYERSYLEVV